MPIVNRLTPYNKHQCLLIDFVVTKMHLIFLSVRFRSTGLQTPERAPELVEKIECYGVVVRTDKKEKPSNRNSSNNIAIFFDEIGDEEQHKLTAYLNQYH